MFELTFEIISSVSSSPSFTMKIGESIPRFAIRYQFGFQLILFYCQFISLLKSSHGKIQLMSYYDEIIIGYHLESFYKLIKKKLNFVVIIKLVLFHTISEYNYFYSLQAYTQITLHFKGPDLIVPFNKSLLTTWICRQTNLITISFPVD